MNSVHISKRKKEKIAKQLVEIEALLKKVKDELKELLKNTSR